MSTSSALAPDPAVRDRRVTLPAGLAVAGVAVTFTGFYLAAGALTPLLVVYQQRWSLSSSMLTLTFAVYAVGFLVAALTLGSLSDRVGRRPVLLWALVVQLLSNCLFLVAPGVGWVIAGRIVQGMASGAATGAFTAALVELAPSTKKRLGTILGSVSLTGGLALGSLLAGLTIQLTRSANTIIFIVLIGLTVLGFIVVGLSPETVRQRPAVLRSLVPRVSVPVAAGKEFVAAAPVVAAVWILAGLSGGIAPSLVRSLFHHDSGLLNGLTGFIAPAVSAVIGLAFARVDPRRAMTLGIYASIVGAIAIIGGVAATSLTVMIIGQAVAGIGFGASFTAALRLVFPLAAEHERAGVVAGIYVVSYVAFAVPIVIEGQLVGPIGEAPAVVCYTAFTVLLALVSLVAQIRLTRATRRLPGHALD